MHWINQNNKTHTQMRLSFYYKVIKKEQKKLRANYNMKIQTKEIENNNNSNNFNYKCIDIDIWFGLWKEEEKTAIPAATTTTTTRWNVLYFILVHAYIFNRLLFTLSMLILFSCVFFPSICFVLYKSLASESSGSCFWHLISMFFSMY